VSDNIGATLLSQPVLARLAEISRRIGDMSPAMLAIGEALTESTKQRFTTSVGPDDKKWKSLSPLTVIERLNEITTAYAYFSDVETRKVGTVRVGDKKGYYDKKGRITKKTANILANMRPLVDTGILQDTITYQLIDNGNGVEIGTNRFAGEWEGGAAVHQFGSEDGTIPARPFLGLSADDETTVLDILDNFAGQAIG